MDSNLHWDENALEALDRGFRKSPIGSRKRKRRWGRNLNGSVKHGRVKQMSDRIVRYSVTLGLRTMTAILDQSYQSPGLHIEDWHGARADLIAIMPTPVGCQDVGTRVFTIDLRNINFEEFVGVGQGLHGLDRFRQVFRQIEDVDEQSSADQDLGMIPIDPDILRGWMLSDIANQELLAHMDIQLIEDEEILNESKGLLDATRMMCRAWSQRIGIVRNTSMATQRILARIVGALRGMKV